MLKNLKMALKMTLGFGLVIALMTVVGILAVMNLLQIQEQAVGLRDRYVPEVAVANNVERRALLTMYAARGFGLGFNDAFKEEALAEMAQLNQYLNEALALGNTHNLPALVREAQEAVGFAATYRGLFDNTITAVDSVSRLRQVTTEAGDEVFAQAEAFFDTQN